SRRYYRGARGRRQARDHHTAGAGAPAAPAGAHLDALEVLLLPRDVEHLVAVPAAQRGQAFREGHALSAVGADPVLGHAGKPGRVFGTRHDGPAVRRSADDVEDRPRDVHGFAADVEQGLTRTELLHL